MLLLVGVLLLLRVCRGGGGEEQQGVMERLRLEDYRQGFRDQNVVGLHVGCGLQLTPTALNTDIQGIADERGKVRSSRQDPLVRVHGDRYFLEHDALQSYPFAPASFDWIFAEHFLEHVPRAGAVRFLREARRLLAPGGVIRISTPDLALYARGVLDPARTFFAAHHSAMTSGPMAGLNTHLRPTAAALFNDLFYSYGHRHIYDFDELLAIADEARVLVPFGDCVARRSAFNASIPLDDPLKAHESLYVDFSCG